MRPQESLILRCPAGASKDEAGTLTVDGSKKRRWRSSFEAPPCGLRALRMREAGGCRAGILW
ncbi:hypothetical protein EFQ99_17610 [Rhizobium vallis]|uniref:Uncharacterized protein n=1 Tax=Rhizobium vallis TaxID=634290 RepID=A0A432PJK4_9HYPH|nr:hypothetical protein EFQ99_17610 [Rhizobium vallis]